MEPSEGKIHVMLDKDLCIDLPRSFKDYYSCLNPCWILQDPPKERIEFLRISERILQNTSKEYETLQGAC